MSERGSFVTQFVQCDECWDGVVWTLIDTDWDGWLEGKRVFERRVAGVVAGTWSGQELQDWEQKYAPELAKHICHPVRIAVLPDSAEGVILTVEPDRKAD